jgi:hypothetical protein
VLIAVVEQPGACDLRHCAKHFCYLFNIKVWIDSGLAQSKAVFAW